MTDMFKVHNDEAVCAKGNIYSVAIIFFVSAESFENLF